MSIPQNRTLSRNSGFLIKRTIPDRGISIPQIWYFTGIPKLLYTQIWYFAGIPKHLHTQISYFARISAGVFRSSLITGRIPHTIPTVIRNTNSATAIHSG